MKSFNTILTMCLFTTLIVSKNSAAQSKNGIFLVPDSGNTYEQYSLHQAKFGFFLVNNTSDTIAYRYNCMTSYVIDLKSNEKLRNPWCYSNEEFRDDFSKIPPNKRYLIYSKYLDFTYVFKDYHSNYEHNLGISLKNGKELNCKINFSWHHFSKNDSLLINQFHAVAQKLSENEEYNPLNPESKQNFIKKIPPGPLKDYLIKEIIEYWLQPHSPEFVMQFLSDNLHQITDQAYKHYLIDNFGVRELDHLSVSDGKIFLEKMLKLLENDKESSRILVERAELRYQITGLINYSLLKK